MSFGTELDAVSTWIYSKITGNAILSDFVGNHPELDEPQVYFKSAAKGARVPYCVFNYLGGTPRNGNSGKKIFKAMRYNIGIVTANSSVKHVMNPLAVLESIFQKDQMTADVVIAGCSLQGDYCIEDILDGGLEITKTGIIVSIMAYPQNPTQI